MTLGRPLSRWLVSAAVLAAGLTAAQTPPPPAAPAVVPRTLDVPDGALVAAGKAPEVEILYTGDVIGYIEPCG
jgi:hypothetical protein